MKKLAFKLYNSDNDSITRCGYKDHLLMVHRFYCSWVKAWICLITSFLLGDRSVSEESCLM